MLSCRNKDLGNYFNALTVVIVKEISVSTGYTENTMIITKQFHSISHLYICALDHSLIHVNDTIILSCERFPMSVCVSDSIQTNNYLIVVRV